MSAPTPAPAAITSHGQNKSSIIGTTIAGITWAIALSVWGCYMLQTPGHEKLEKNTKVSLEQMFSRYAPTGAGETLLSDKAQTLFDEVKGNTTQRIFMLSPTDQINNNDPKDGVWFDNGDTYVNCKTDSQTFWPKTLIISAHNVADADKKLVDFVWHISIDEDVVTITKNGEEVKGTDTQKDEYLEKVFRDLGSNF